MRIPPLAALLRSGRLAVLAAVLAAVLGCQTLQYRQIQNDFQQAVAADNDPTGSPFINWYEGVTQDLTDAYIGGLPAKMRPNAWMLRGVSEWRVHQYDAAYRSAEQGDAALKPLVMADKKWEGSRDSIMLSLLPALVQDSQLRDHFQADAGSLSTTRYESNYLPAFKAIVEQLGDARSKCGPETSPGVLEYWGFHSWRVLEDWQGTMAGLRFDEFATARKQAHLFLTNMVFGERFPGTTNFPAMVNAISNTLTGNEYYVRRMATESVRSQ